MAGDPFTSAIFRWLNAVAADPMLPPAAFKLGYLISQHINRATHQAWPSQETLRDAMGLKDERSVRRLTDALEERGYLITRRGRRISMTYWLALDRTELSYQGEQTEAEPELRPDNSVRSTDVDRTFDASRPDIFMHQDRTKMSAKPLIEPLIEPERGSARARADFLPDDFAFEDRAWAIERLGTAEAVEHSLERFGNHYRQVDGDRARSRDWQAKARLWIDDDARRTPPDKSVHAAAKRLQDRLASFDARPAPPALEAAWDGVLSTYRKLGVWTKHVSQFGPSPDSPDCRAPQHLLAKHGLVSNIPRRLAG